MFILCRFDRAGVSSSRAWDQQVPFALRSKSRLTLGQRDPAILLGHRERGGVANDAAGSVAHDNVVSGPIVILGCSRRDIGRPVGAAYLGPILSPLIIQRQGAGGGNTEACVPAYFHCPIGRLGRE